MATSASALRPGGINPSAVVDAAPTASQHAVPADVSTSIAALSNAHVVQRGLDGLPLFLTGDLGHVGRVLSLDHAAVDAQLAGGLAGALGAFRLTSAELALHRVRRDANGNVHVHFRQMHDGLEVVGGDMVVHVDAKGTIYAINGTARGGFSSYLSQRDVGESAALNRVSAVAEYAGLRIDAGRKLYFLDEAGIAHLAYEVMVSGDRDEAPVRDMVYVDAANGKILAVHPKVYQAESRKIYSANNGTSLPGTLKRSEGGAATTDTDVNAAYDGTGATYEAYKLFWNRDSYNNAGATLISSVHYSTNYCNAYWNSSQMVYGDGNSSQNCAPLARAQDVTGHELTHAVTENESGLVYSGESGGLNEAMSDIFGAFTEAYVDGGKTGTLAVSSNTWKVGELVIPPALRYMNDPAADGASLDYYTSTAGSKDVHYSSGIANLAFYLLSQGGTHPRGKSSVQVTGVGMTKAIRIFYEAQINVLTSSSNFLAAGNATVLAAQNLGYSVADQTSVANAWQAVGVPVPTPGGGGGGGGGGTTTLSNGVPVTGISDAKSGQKFYSLVVPSGQTSLSFTISGGTGDADMYVRAGSAPTLTAYDCRPYKSGNAETCTFTNPAAGTYYVMLNGYAAYSGVTLTGTYSASGGGDGVTVLTNGVAVTSLSGAASSAAYWKISTPAGKTLTVKMSGGTGDADLYTQFNAKPTTSSYLCRPYLTGNAETCTTSSTQSGYYYIMIRGYSSYSGVSLVASY